MIIKTELIPKKEKPEAVLRHSILFNVKEGENFNRRNILNILRIKI